MLFLISTFMFWFNTHFHTNINVLSFFSFSFIDSNVYSINIEKKMEKRVFLTFLSNLKFAWVESRFQIASAKIMKVRWFVEWWRWIWGRILTSSSHAQSSLVGWNLLSILTNRWTHEGLSRNAQVNFI